MKFVFKDEPEPTFVDVNGLEIKEVQHIIQKTTASPK